MAKQTLTLDAMTAQLRAAYGGGLRAVVLYGPAARSGAAAGRGALALLVVVDALGIEVLRRVAPTVRAWREAGHPAPLTLTAREWASSADVFPMEYAEVLGAHRVLAGALPLDGVAVDAGDLRRQLEHQALGALLHLRAGVLAAGNDARQVAALLAGGPGRVLALFRALARLHGADPDQAPSALAEWAGRTAEFAAAPVVRVVAGGAGLPPGEAERVAAGYLTALERLVAHVDALPVDAPPVGARNAGAAGADLMR